MNATEAVLLVREHFYRVPGVLPDIGFEKVGISRYDFHEWEIECKVFDILTSTMVLYKVIISDDKVSAVRRI